MKRILSSAALLVALLVVAGCGQQSDSTNAEPAEHSERVGGYPIRRATFLDGSVLVEYKQERGTVDDSMTLVFYAPGHYHVDFSDSPGHASMHMPKDFDIDVQQNPRAQVINQPHIPDYVRVTIVRDDQSEHHDFE